MSRVKANIKYTFTAIHYKKYPLRIDVMSIEETIKNILNSQKSVVRFGDGEIRLIKGENIIFQGYHPELAERLEKILSYEDKSLIVCLPDTFHNISRFVRKTRVSWSNHFHKYREVYTKNCLNKRYGNAFISRPYITYRDKSESGMRFELLKKLWEQRNVVLIEGEYSRIGVGNDLFNDVQTLERIICPSQNAYSKFDIILEEALCIEKDKLILVSLGPTAKPLAFELNREGYQVIDIGHIDSEYEWYLSGAKNKKVIEGKHTADMKDKGTLSECKDKDYLNQISSTLI